MTLKSYAKFKKNKFVVSKMTFGEFWSEHSKFSTICTLIGLFRAKYITFELSKYRGFMSHDTEESYKNWRKTDLWFWKWHAATFHQHTWKCQNWDLDGIVLAKVENGWVKNLQRSDVEWHWRMMKNLKRNGLVISKLL